MLLVSGATTTFRPQMEARPDIFGALMVPRDGNSVPESGRWAADNGAFSGFDEDVFLAMLARHRWARDRCVFVAAPDVVGDSVATMELFSVWEPRLRALGYPVALVAQNGLRRNTVPWDRIDAIFIGGTTKWKLGGDAALIIRRANELEKWLHMGRVNTARRIRYAALMGCDSIDGSGFSKWPKDMLARHGGLLRDLASQRRLILSGFTENES
jgi:hypothetical protein